MKKWFKGAVLGICVVLPLSGCGLTKQNTQAPGNETTAAVVEEEHQVIEELKGIALSGYKAVSIKKEDPAEILLEAEADGDEEVNAYNSDYERKVYSQPNTSSGVVGKIKRNTDFNCIEMLDSGKWYKISFNGRVAYVLVDPNTSYAVEPGYADTTGDGDTDPDGEISTDDTVIDDTVIDDTDPDTDDPDTSDTSDSGDGSDSGDDSGSADNAGGGN